VILKDLERVNDLWSKIYPYLAAQVMESYGRNQGEVLELGPFSGGISAEMAMLYPGLNITIAAEDGGVVNLLRDGIEAAGLGRDIGLKRSELDHLVFEDSHFDLIIFRGAYFFLDQEGKILREIYRVLKQGGLAIIGGGYGKNTPQALIEEIAEESRDLNDKLGRKRVTEDELETIVMNAGLADHARIEKSGGLWLGIRK
jgi:ubiquinone/menaquinone biosynthesis C-methylase UbiE